MSANATGPTLWGIFRDTADETRYLETFFVESWLEHLRQHQRVTKADRKLEDQVRRYARGRAGGDPSDQAVKS